MSTLYHDSIPTASGIYRITCTANGKIYVGSASNLRERRQHHFRDLRRNEHCNQYLQRAWNKYGPDTFMFEVLEYVLLPELLTAREQYWFDHLRPFGHRGFNIERVAGSPLGRKHTPESRAKLSAAKKGKPNPHPGNNYSVRGRPLSLEHRSKISAAHRGKPGTNLGKKYTPEHRSKISNSLRGRKSSPEAIEKIRLTKIGNTNKAKHYTVTSPEGIEYTVYNLAAFCREHNLSKVNLGKVALGTRSHSKGWKARFLDNPPQSRG